MGNHPRQHVFHRRSFKIILPSASFGLDEGLVEGLSDPTMRVVNVAPDHHRVHNRKDVSLGIIVALDRFVILKQSTDRTGPAVHG